VARSSQPLEKLREEYPDQVEPLVGDLADFTLGQKAVDLAVSRWKQLDGLIVNHGVLNPVKRIADTDAEEWRSAFDVNAFSAIAMVDFVLMRRFSADSNA
jgi:NADP-dependent 3-hydroxy acid dehydrogenase YdfG